MSVDTFYVQQANARRNSAALLVAFTLAVLSVALILYGIVTLAALPLNEGQTPDGTPVPAGLWNPTAFLISAGTALLVVGGGSYGKTVELRGDIDRIPRSLGGRLVPPETLAPEERQLRNVVEEMAIASGVRVPNVYVLDAEPGINAFTTGFDADTATITVTHGAVALLTRDELQAVVAHEFSHILNGDTALDVRLIGWLHGMRILGKAGEAILDTSSRLFLRHYSVLLILIGAPLYIAGYTGYVLARWIKAGVSRQRELLGDASSVQFTRNPAGLAGALKKIGGLAEGSRLVHRRADEVSHLCFCDALSAPQESPSLQERIRRLDPAFDGAYPTVAPLPPPPPEPEPPSTVSRATFPPALSTTAVNALLAHAGAPMQERLAAARRLRDRLPHAVTDASRQPLGACALVYGLLLDPDPAVRTLQEAQIAANDGPEALAETRRLLPDLQTMTTDARLPLLDLSLPALRALTPDQFANFRATVVALADADSRESLFEFLLRYLLLRHLEPRFDPRPAPVAQVYGIAGVEQECAQVLTAMARIGPRSEDDARAAFDAGLRILQSPGATFAFLPADAGAPERLTPALRTLESAGTQIKRRLLAACLECLSHDRTVTRDEMELFRAVADALGVPIPPWLDLGETTRQTHAISGVG